MILIESNILTLMWKTCQILELDYSQSNCGTLGNISYIIFLESWIYFSCILTFISLPTLVMIILHIFLFIYRVYYTIFFYVWIISCIIHYFCRWKNVASFMGEWFFYHPYNSFLNLPLYWWLFIDFIIFNNNIKSSVRTTKASL